MKQQFILFKRAGVFYSENTVKRKQISLRTKVKAEAIILLNAKNEGVRQPNLNLELARTYLSASDPETAQRTWQRVMDEMKSHGKDATKKRYACAMRSAHYLKRVHNLAFGLGWIAAPVLPPKKRPKIHFKAKRGITLEEHEKIITAEKNIERKLYYQMLWEIGASQSDAAALSADNVDSKKQSLSYRRMKTGSLAQISVGKNLRALLALLPASGLFFRKSRQAQIMLAHLNSLVDAGF